MRFFELSYLLTIMLVATLWILAPQLRLLLS